MSQPKNPLRLLIVEDDPDQRELVRQTLAEHFGDSTLVDVSTIGDAMAQDIPTFDLVLSDFNLPDGTGMELLEHVRRRCDTPLVLVTGENVGRMAAESIRKGATDYIVKVGDYLVALPLVVEKSLAVAKMRRENEVLRTELEVALGALREKNVALEQSLRRTEEAAATDPLTGLYNRRHFGKVLAQLYSEACRYESDIAVVMIDLDEYKKLNDTCGHQVGDRMLLVAARAITANMRVMDVASRYGGDEFVLLAPRAAGPEAATIAERIRQEYRKASAMILRRNEGLTMSFGVASLRSDGSASADELVAAADAALYQAKEAGRNRIVISTPVIGR
jgi:two-component system cell cycle response regulator